MGFNQPLFLTRVVVHQGAGPGALSSVEARGLEGGPWKPLWQRDEAEAAAYTKQQLELQPLQWQGVTPTKSLRLNVDTSLVPGFNQVDAVEVHGLAEDGAPVSQTVGGTCPPGGTACWVECQPLQVGGGQNARVALEALDGAVRWLRSALQTAPKTAPLPIAGPGSTALPACAEVLASLAAANGGQTEYHNTDLLVVPTTRPNPRSPLELQVCSQTEFGQRDVLHLNFAPEFLTQAVAAAGLGTLQERALEDAVLHELYQGLGWMGKMQYRELAQEGNTGGWADREKWGIISPKIMDVAAAHFGVASVPFVEIEGQGLAPAGTGSRVYLESRLFLGELMAPQPFLVPSATAYDAVQGWTVSVDRLYRMVRSAISLAGLEDTGYYLPDYGRAELLKWGAGGGLGTVNNPCIEWDTMVCKDVVKKFQMIRAGEMPEKECSHDRVFKGSCVLTEYNMPPPASQRYFGLTNPNFGGVSALTDYCPVVVPARALPYTAPAAYGSPVDCTDASRAPETQVETHGDASRCFSGIYEQKTFVGCFLHSCVGGKLFVNVNDEYRECPTDGGAIFIPSLQLSVECPKAATMCPFYAADVKPGLDLIRPAQNDIISTDYTLAYSTPNLAAGATPNSTRIDLALDGMKIRSWPTSVATGELLKELALSALPDTHAVTAQLQMTLVDGDAVVDTATTDVVLTPYVEQFAALAIFDSSASHELAFSYNKHTKIQATVPQATEISTCRFYIKTKTTSLKRIYAKRIGVEEYALVWSAATPLSSVNFDAAQNGYAYVIPNFARPGFVSTTFVLEFDSFQDVDDGPKFRVTGTTATLPPVALDPANEYSHTVSDGGAKEVAIALDYGGSLSMVYEATAVGDSAGMVFAPKGLFPGAGPQTFRLTLDPSLAKLRTSTATIQLRDFYSKALLVEFAITMSVYHDDPAPVNGCVHGVVELSADGRSQVCNCFGGAYGPSCESLRCPNDCKSADGIARGTCDHASGACQCLPGFHGPDCTAHYGHCFVSPSEGCPAGWDVRKYVLNTEDAFNLNAALNPLRNQVACKNPGECSRFARWTYCCEAEALQSCPFPAGSKPCTMDECYQEVVGPEGLRERQFQTPDRSNEVCQSTIEAFCRTESVVGCLLFLDRTVQRTCPTRIGLEFCQAHPAHRACRDLAVVPPRCDFQARPDTGYSPCESISCTADFFSPGCVAEVKAHCRLHSAAEPDCELFGFGDSCFFKPGSAPCLAPACDDLGSAACRDVIRDYCEYAAGEDPECNVHIEPEGWDARFTTKCPWAAVAEACLEKPLEPSCAQLAGKDLAGATQVTIGGVKALRDGGHTGVFQTALGAETRRRRLTLAVMQHLVTLYGRVDLNGDRYLDPAETADLRDALGLLKRKVQFFNKATDGGPAVLDALVAWLDATPYSRLAELQARALAILDAM